MTQPTEPTRKDDQLAEFADRVLKEGASGAAFSEEADVRSLQETVVRLDRALSGKDPDPAAVQRMLAGFQSAVRTQERTNRPAWRSRRTRQRLILGFTALALVAALLFVLPFLPASAGGVEGTAGLWSSAPVLLGVLGALALLFLWLNRRN